MVGESYGNFPIPEPTPVGYYGTWVAEVDAGGALTDGGSVVHRAPSESLYGGGYAVAVRPNGSSLVVGRRADTAGDLLTTEDILIMQGGAYSALGTPGNDAIYSGPLAGPSRGMPLQLTGDGGSILAATTNGEGLERFWMFKLNRTAGINLEALIDLSGSSFVNKDAASTERSSNPTDQPVMSTPFTLPVTAESTDVSLGFWIDNR